MGETKGRMRKIEQNHVLKKNQENLNSIIMPTDTRTFKSPVIELNELPWTKNVQNFKYNAHVSKETIKDNTKKSILDTILRKLQVNVNSCNAQRALRFDGESTKMLANTRKLKFKQATHYFKNSVTPEKRNNLNCSTEKSLNHADVQYNFRKRKSKIPEELQADEFQNNQSELKKSRRINTANIDINCVEQCFLLLNEENSFEDTDDDSENDYHPRQKIENRRPIKITNSKLSQTIGYSPPQKRAKSEKQEASRRKSKSRVPLNNKASIIESEDVLFTMGENNRIAVENKLSGNNAELVKNPQTAIRSIDQNLHSNVDHNYISQPNISKEQKKFCDEKNSCKKSENDNYIKYLVKIFKNIKSSPQRAYGNTLLTFQEQNTREKSIPDCAENEELFSLSSSDSDDNEEPQKNRRTFGLLDNILDDYEEE